MTDEKQNSELQTTVTAGADLSLVTVTDIVK